MRSSQQHLFSHVPSTNIPRSTFNRSHGHKTTFDAGWLIPIYVDEALPGDTFNVQLAAFARLATPIVPIMDNLWMDFFFFAIPNRLLWDNWQKFMGEQTSPGDSTDYLVPHVNVPTTGWERLSLADYFGLPTDIPGANGQACAFPFRAYNLVYNEWFRDENLQTPTTVKKDDGPDDPALYNLKKRSKRHDYFTSCLPWPQKGVGVELPIGATAPVKAINANVPPYFATGAPNQLMSALSVQPGTGGNQQPVTKTSQILASDVFWGPPGQAGINLEADLTNATATTIAQLREAFQIQRLLERDARGGTRYTEILRSHFGVISPDARLQRPEYLGGGTVAVNINPVAQTSATAKPTGIESATPQGNLAAFGTAAARGIGFVKSFVEHMTIIGLVMVRADLNYQQGLHRMWSRKTRFDYYWPAFSHLGEQAVLNKEIYLAGQPIDNDVFGYQERWAEYRYFPSLITGAFRSNYSSDGGTTSDPLDYWHLAQNFVGTPVLNNGFIEENPPIPRIVAVPSEPHFLFDSIITIKAARPMPTYSVPGLIDHF